MPVPRAFKTDESFLEKIAIGATGTRRVFDDLAKQEHEPIELERGSMSFKIWKAIKIKRVRVPDILCLRCSHRWESRAKTKMTITMSHSMSDPERGWDFGLSDADFVALVHCIRTGDGPLDWQASSLVQYIRVADLRRAWASDQVKTQKAKGAQEGFEVQVTWPGAIASAAGVVEMVTGDALQYRPDGSQRASTVRLKRPSGRLLALVAPGECVQESQILAAVVPVTAECPCPSGADLNTYVQMAASTALSDRYTAVKALARISAPKATEALLARMNDSREHVYVRVDSAAGLARRGQAEGLVFLSQILDDPYLENQLEAAIILGEVATPDAAKLLMKTLADAKQHPEIRAGTAWALGEIGTADALPALIESFNSLDLIIRIEAARALAKLARQHQSAVLRAFPAGTIQERPGIAWALSKAGNIRIGQILPGLVDEDARQWISYIIGTQERETMLPEIEELARQDPAVYFAVTVLWKILASWIYGLEEY